MHKYTHGIFPAWSVNGHEKRVVYFGLNRIPSAPVPENDGEKIKKNLLDKVDRIERNLNEDINETTRKDYEYSLRVTKDTLKRIQELEQENTLLPLSKEFIQGKGIISRMGCERTRDKLTLTFLFKPDQLPIFVRFDRNSNKWLIAFDSENGNYRAAENWSSGFSKELTTRGYRTVANKIQDRTQPDFDRYIVKNDQEKYVKLQQALAAINTPAYEPSVTGSYEELPLNLPPPQEGYGVISSGYYGSPEKGNKAVTGCRFMLGNQAVFNMRFVGEQGRQPAVERIHEMVQRERGDPKVAEKLAQFFENADTNGYIERRGTQPRQYFNPNASILLTQAGRAALFAILGNTNDAGIRVELRQERPAVQAPSAQETVAAADTTPPKPEAPTVARTRIENERVRAEREQELAEREKNNKLWLSLRDSVLVPSTTVSSTIDSIGDPIKKAAAKNVFGNNLSPLAIKLFAGTGTPTQEQLTLLESLSNEELKKLDTNRNDISQGLRNALDAPTMDRLVKIGATENDVLNLSAALNSELPTKNNDNNFQKRINEILSEYHANSTKNFAKELALAKLRMIGANPNSATDAMATNTPENIAKIGITEGPDFARSMERIGGVLAFMQLLIKKQVPAAERKNELSEREKLDADIETFNKRTDILGTMKLSTVVENEVSKLQPEITIKTGVDAADILRQLQVELPGVSPTVTGNKITISNTPLGSIRKVLDALKKKDTPDLIQKREEEQKRVATLELRKNEGKTEIDKYNPTTDANGIDRAVQFSTLGNTFKFEFDATADSGKGAWGVKIDDSWLGGFGVQQELSAVDTRKYPEANQLITNLININKKES